MTPNDFEESLRTPYLITATIEACLALACSAMGLFAPDFRVFFTLAAYCAMVGLQLMLAMADLPTAAQSALTLNPGDRLTLLTDGVPEAQNLSRELFGFERTAAISTQSAESIAHAAQAFGQSDDITVLTLSLAAPEAHAQ